MAASVVEIGTEQFGYEMVTVPTVFGSGFDKAAVFSVRTEQFAVFEFFRGFEESDPGQGL
ncbi:hypothetical protein QMA15_31825 [Rhodococcus sp. APC 3903]|nr:hypothetical protein [Rhodococcus sp. APC 3903]